MKPCICKLNGGEKVPDVAVVEGDAAEARWGIAVSRPGVAYDADNDPATVPVHTTEESAGVSTAVAAVDAPGANYGVANVAGQVWWIPVAA